MEEKPSVKIYKTIAYAFIIIAVILIGIIVFVSLSKAEITVYPETATFESDFVLNGKIDASQREFEEEQIIPFEIREVETSVSETFQTTGSVENEDNIVTTVILVNDSEKVQPLIKTTRIQTEEGYLLRLSDGVTLNPGDRVSASVYADDLESVKGKEVKAQKMVFPGLWEGLSELIYAEVNENFVINPEEMMAVTKEDLEMAENQLQERLKDQVLQEKQYEYPESIILPLRSEVTGFQPSADIGDLKVSFDALISGKVTVAFLSKEQLRLAGYQILKTRLRPNQNLLKFDDSNFTYGLGEWDEAENMTVTSHFEGETTLAPIHEIVDKKELMGKSKKDIYAYFEEFPNVEKVDVKFTPSWMLKTPLLMDHIQIRIE